MDPIRFDRLAKAVAAPLPRRALLAGALAAALSRRTEAAAQQSCCQLCTQGGGQCLPDPRGRPECVCCDGAWCIGPSGAVGCCHPGETCCPATAGCCKAEQGCFPTGCRVCPSGTTKCGQNCVRACPSGFALNQRTCTCDCPSGVICGPTGVQQCCSAGLVCIGNRCVIPQDPPGSQTCAIGIPCGSTCCRRSEECSDPSTGKCCPFGTSCGRQCSSGPGVAQGLVCCNPDFSLLCNVATHVCCDGECCNKTTQSCVNGNCVLRRRPPTRRGGT